MDYPNTEQDDRDPWAWPFLLALPTVVGLMWALGWLL